MELIKIFSNFLSGRDGPASNSPASAVRIDKVVPPRGSRLAAKRLQLAQARGAFFLQYVTGFVVNLWSSHAGHYPPLAYRAAFALIVILQIAAIIWFAYPAIRARRSLTIKISLRATSLEG